jgi:AcrR family transcriptional regulator
MHRLLDKVVIKIDEKLFLKNPMTSDIGQEMVRQSVIIIAAEGLEGFNFKKLALALGSTETTIYRYFNNKQQLMMYLASWYWGLLEWRIAFATTNVNVPSAKLDKALLVLSTPMNASAEIGFMNECKLQSIVASESFKAFEMKGLLKKDRIGYFKAYSNLCIRVSELITLNNKNHKFPKAMAATIIETAHYQMFLQNNMPELTDLPAGETHLYSLLHQLAFKALEEKK